MADKAPDITITNDAAPKRRGRPPGSTNKVTGTAADVAKAIATLDSAYNLIATGLMMFGLTETATAWVDTAEDLKKTNKDSLTAAPKLAKYIANAGSAGGAGTLFITHGMAFAGVTRIAMGELAERRAEREAREKIITDPADSNTPDPTLIPGL